MKNKAYDSGARARGLTLIELMIALLIGTILVLGLVQVFAGSRAAYQLSQGIARNQESSRFAVDFLTRDLRMAGHAGCVNDQSLLATTGGVVTGGNIRSLFLSNANRDSNTLTGLPFPLRFDVSIQGFEANGTAPGNAITLPATPVAGLAADWTPALPATLSSLGALKGSDIVVLRFLSPEESPITTFNAAGAPAVIYPAASGTVATGGSGLYAIADCRGATVFQASAAPTATQMNVAVGGLNLSNLSYISTQDRSLAYKAGSAALFRAESMAYYIALNGQGQPGLFRTRWTSVPGSSAVTPQTDEMVDGIESMQFLYGRDSVTDPALPPLGYVATMDTAAVVNAAATDPAAAWRRVGAVQVGLLVRNGGPERAASEQAAIAPAVLQVAMTPPADANYRTPYETTVALRNRLYGN